MENKEKGLTPEDIQDIIHTQYCNGIFLGAVSTVCLIERDGYLPEGYYRKLLEEICSASKGSVETEFIRETVMESIPLQSWEVLEEFLNI